MAKVRGVESKLTRLRLIRNEPITPAVIAELRDGLSDKSNFVAAAAAEIVGERTLTDLVPDLVAAFRRFLIDPVETDKLCKAKIEMVEALNRLEADEEDVYRAGLRHIQMEPAWGGPEDTAAPLRAAAAFALVRVNPRDLIVLLADLLADPEKVARVAAAKALGACGHLAAIPLLRFKARVGDEEPEVIVECLTALVSAEPDESIPFVGGFLNSRTEEVAAGAALALAESRRPAALELLKQFWPKARRDESLAEVVLLGIAITRLPAGIDFLLELLAQGEAPALKALAIHKHNPAVRERVAAVVAKKGAGLKKAFEKEFPSDDPGQPLK
jgi:hypothetical protein